MPLQGFLDIDIGDPQRYNEESAAYKLASDFLSVVGVQVGFSAIHFKPHATVQILFLCSDVPVSEQQITGMQLSTVRA